MKEILKSKNLSVTKFRLEVLEIFKKYSTTISVQQIEDELESFDRVSLYRTLKTFKEKGIIHEITMPDEVPKMALCPDDCQEDNHSHEHIHFHCRKCSEVLCVDIEKVPNIELKGFAVERVEVQAFGICSNCL